jgi:energy-coupling factor transport system ATP-binding protein
MIEIKGLKFSYNNDTEAEIQALAGVDAFIHKGEFVAVIGHNGCGKSTLAKHLNALLLPAQGKVTSLTVWTRLTKKNSGTSEKPVEWFFRILITRLLPRLLRKMSLSDLKTSAFPPEEIRTRIDSALESVG